MATRLFLTSGIAVCALALVGVGCRSAEPAVTTPSADIPVAATEEPGSWVPDTRGPWDGSLYQTSSSDGMAFSGKTLVLEQAGVPNLLRLPTGELILTYQYFSSESRDLFDAIAYSVSDDNGATWSAPKPVALSGVPTPAGPNLKPMDPTLVRAEDGSLRLYFTYHAKGKKSAELYVAVQDEGDIAATFVTQVTPALSVPGAFLLDPAVTFFDGVWHHYTWQDKSDGNYHSTSTDGLTFALSDDISLPMDFLGQVVPFGEGLRFYGTGKGSVDSAYSADGETWTMDTGSRSPGADPAIAILDDGTYLMVYTAANFNE